MKNKMLYLKIVLLLIVVTIGGILRLHNYDKVPLPGESMDEYRYTWVGMSLIKMGLPVGISGIDGYKNRESHYINVDGVYQSTAAGDPQTINWSWFDHPPLLGLVTGGYALTKGADVFGETNIFIIRKPMVALGIVTLGLLMILAWINFGFETGMVAGLIYAVSPVVVVGSRMVQGENGVIPFFLLSLIGTTLYLKQKEKKWLILGAMAAGVACLFKLSGGVAILSGLLLLGWKRKREMLEFGVVAGSIASLFLIYGLTLDWSQFVAILGSNGQRFYGIGPEAMYNLLTQVKITNTRFLTDPWVILGWISVAVIAFKKHLKLGEKMIVIGTFVYLAIYLFLGSYSYGWYVYPFFPLLIMALGRVLAKAFYDSKRLLLSGMMLLVPVGYLLTKFVTIERFQNYATGWRVGIILLMFSLLIIRVGLIKNKIALIVAKISVGLLMAGAIYLSIRYNLMLTTDYWYKVI